MRLSEFKEKYWDTAFSTKDAIIEAAKEDDLDAAGIVVYTNMKNSYEFYTIRSTKYTLKRPGSNASFLKQVMSICDSTFEELKDRHYRFAQKQLDNLSDSKSLFRMVFGYTEPGDSGSQSSGIELQKPIYNKNKK